MSTSGSVSFNMTATEIVTKAFHILGKASEGEALTARMHQDGMSSLNLLLKTLGAQEHLWIKTEGTLALIAGQAAYNITPKPGRILSVRRRQTYGSSQTDTPMNEMARDTYFNQPTKTTSPSTPVSWYYDPQTTTGTLYLWPAPSTAIIASQSINFTWLRRIQDMVQSDDDLDMPQEWFQAVIWQLADDLETEYPVNDPRLAQKIERKAAGYISFLKQWDTEPASIFFQPDYEFTR